MYHEAITPHLVMTIRELGDIRQLTSSLVESIRKPKEVVRTFLEYHRVSGQLINLTQEDREIITQVNHRLGTENQGADYFLQELGEENRKPLLQIIDAAADPISKFYLPAFYNLSNMMHNADPLYLAGEKPQDGDPKWDNVIWGYTQIAHPENNTETIRQFVMGHYLERFVAGVLINRNVEMAQHKDFFLNALTDVIALGEAGNPSTAPLFPTWFRPKNEGGLGWISKQRFEAYQKAIG